MTTPDSNTLFLLHLGSTNRITRVERGSFTAPCCGREHALNFKDEETRCHGLVMVTALVSGGSWTGMVF